MVVVVGGRRSSGKRSLGRPESVACRGPPERRVSRSRVVAEEHFKVSSISRVFCQQ